MDTVAAAATVLPPPVEKQGERGSRCWRRHRGGNGRRRRRRGGGKGRGKVAQGDDVDRAGSGAKGTFLDVDVGVVVAS